MPESKITQALREERRDSLEMKLRLDPAQRSNLHDWLSMKPRPVPLDERRNEVTGY